MDNYVVLKLVTGEQLLATLVNETDDGIVILDPITVRMIPTVGGGAMTEQAITSIYCQFSDDKMFVFDYKNIIYCKEMSSKIVAYYKKLVREFNEDNRDVQDFYNEEGHDELDQLQKPIKLH